MATEVALGFSSWQRVIRIMEEVTLRMLRVTGALDRAGIPYAVIGGNAVATYVGRIDKAAVRLTQDVDILLDRSDLPAAREVLERAGFLYHETLDVHMFLDSPQATPREAVHVLFASEKVQKEYHEPTPRVSESEAAERFRVLSLEALVRMKLTSYRRKDQVHIQDLIGVGLIDATWPARFAPELAARLQELLDDPLG
jgi:hypothetical protein